MFVILNVSSFWNKRYYHHAYKPDIFFMKIKVPFKLTDWKGTNSLFLSIIIAFAIRQLASYDKWNVLIKSYNYDIGIE